MSATLTASAKKWAREYETIYILRPTISTDAAESVAQRARDVIGRLDGTLTKVNNWGKRLLAYPIQRHNRGTFVHLVYVGYSDLVAELERNLGLLDEVIRFQTVVLRQEVDPGAVEVDPEEVQFLHVEDDGDEPDVDRARQLGLEPDPVRPPPSAEGAGAAAMAGAAAGAAADAPEGAAAEGAGGAAPSSAEGATPDAATPAAEAAPATASESTPQATASAPEADAGSDNNPEEA